MVAGIEDDSAASRFAGQLHLSAAERAELVASGLEVGPVSLQQLIVRQTQHAAPIDEGALR